MQKAGPPRWSFVRGQLIRMINCRRLVHRDDHLQEAGQSGWSFSFVASYYLLFVIGHCLLLFVVCHCFLFVVACFLSFAVFCYCLSLVVVRHLSMLVVCCCLLFVVCLCSGLPPCSVIPPIAPLTTFLSKKGVISTYRG